MRPTCTGLLGNFTIFLKIVWIIFGVFDTFKENGKNILIFPYYLIIHIQLSYVLSYNKSDR